MAPSSGHILVPKAMNAFKYAISKGTAFIRGRLQQETSKPILESIPIQVTKQPIHPLAALRQSRSQQRNFSTLIRRLVAGAGRPAASVRPSPPSVRAALSRSTFAPFTSPLRPNLTGGALPRASGGYSLGGGVRHFSHTPAAQAQVIHNVSAAIRAFCVNGFKAQYDGVDSKTGKKRFRAVNVKQEEALSKFRGARPCGKGTTLEFRIAPTITSVSPLADAENTIDSATVLPGLASDFARSLADLSLVHADLKRLSELGSLPICQPNPHTLEVRFPGCDAVTVNSLCDELGIQRGIVREDPEWDAEDGDKDVGMALLFPWAPSQAPSHVSDDLAAGAYFSHTGKPAVARTLGPAESLEWASMLSATSPGLESMAKSQDGFSAIEPSHDGIELANPWLVDSANSGDGSFEDLRQSELGSNDGYDLPEMDLARTETLRPIHDQSRQRSPQSFADYDGTEGILRFLEVCDGARTE